MTSRRKFIEKAVQGIGLSLYLPSALSSCSPAQKFIPVMSGQNAAFGHRLRTMDFGPAKESIQTDVVIVGGGVSGLSAARHLRKNGNSFLLLEMGTTTGGNSLGGHNDVSAFPLGAHYLPIPDERDEELISFLQESGIIKSFENGLPVYDEYALCFDPKERLYINNYWQDGLIPEEGVPQKDRNQSKQFGELMAEFKNRKGSDGLDAFAIPVAKSSRDPELLALDTISMATFLHDHKLDSPYLLWHINYCCLDDFGSTIHDTSAWAAIHYFASRKGKSSNAAPDDVLTWPEGNYRLIKKLSEGVQSEIRSQALVYEVRTTQSGCEVMFYDAEKDSSTRIVCRSVIMATPQFITNRLLGSNGRTTDFAYSSWMVANLTTNSSLNEKRGEGLCWDNVIYGSQALGYIHAGHQSIGQPASENKVLTYYYPIPGSSTDRRKQTQENKLSQWQQFILSDLKQPHPEIEKHILDLNLWIWGHGMIKPVPGFIWDSARRSGATTIEKKIYFAHSDLSGISIFEEAFHHGLNAAKAVISNGIIG